MRARTAIALIGLAAAAAAGCGGGGAHLRRHAGLRVIYTSLPSHGPFAAAASAVYDGEQLALAQAGGQVNGFQVVLRRLDDGGVGPEPTATTVASSARVAAGDASTIAYLGDLTPGSSSASIPILSEAGILQVSPGDPGAELDGATFARVVPADTLQASAQLDEMARLGVRRLYVLQDTSTYGADLASATTAGAPGRGIEVVDPRGRYLQADTRPLVRSIRKSRADGLVYAGLPSDSLAALWNGLAASSSTIRKFAPASVTFAPNWPLTTPPALYDTFLSSPGLASRELPRAGTQFEADFVSAYGARVPWTSGIFGYVAMSGVLAAMHERGSMDRARVLAAYMRLHDLPSALGTYSITDGATSFDRYFFTTYSSTGHPEGL